MFKHVTIKNEMNNDPLFLFTSISNSQETQNYIEDNKLYVLINY